jgi:hypothetical protein
VAAGVPLFTDNHVRQQIVDGLRARGWDVVRAIDVFPERTDDERLFAWAAENGRIFVSSDEPAQEIPKRWLRERRFFLGMICWPQKHHRRMSDGEFISALERGAADPQAFAYPIYYIKPGA